MDESTRMCNKCGTVRGPEDWYPDRKNGTRQAWCKPCYREWHRARYLPKDEANDAPRACQVCGASYRPNQRRPSVYCSRSCKDVARNAARAIATMATKPARICLQCGVNMPQSMRVDAKFCSEECNYAAHALKRKLRARGGPQESPGYVRLEIAERDRWRCGICGGKVSKDHRYPDPLAGSLDHVVPVSQGGTSEPANLRLTHLVCNLRRRNVGGGEQLAII